MKGWAVFIIILLFLAIGGYAGWVLYSRLRAKRLGLEPPPLLPFASSRGDSSSNFPAPAPGGIRGWFDTQVRRFKNRNNRYATGAYEEPSTYSGAAGGGRTRGAGHRLDPDEAWDARVGNEAYYEEQELGLHAPAAGGGGNPYGSSYVEPSPGFVTHEPERGRSRTREYGDEGSSLHDGRSATNPFGDENAASLRGVSPRPLDHGEDTSYGGASVAPKRPVSAQGGHSGDSPTERRSMFRENM